VTLERRTLFLPGLDEVGVDVAEALFLALLGGESGFFIQQLTYRRGKALHKARQ
jgi:hypothetical protein